VIGKRIGHGNFNRIGSDPDQAADVDLVGAGQAYASVGPIDTHVGQRGYISQIEDDGAVHVLGPERHGLGVDPTAGIGLESIFAPIPERNLTPVAVERDG